MIVCDVADYRPSKLTFFRTNGRLRKALTEQTKYSKFHAHWCHKNEPHCCDHNYLLNLCCDVTPMWHFCLIGHYFVFLTLFHCYIVVFASFIDFNRTIVFWKRHARIAFNAQQMLFAGIVENAHHVKSGRALAFVCDCV